MAFCVNIYANIRSSFEFIVFLTIFISRIIALKLNFELTKVTKLEKSPTHLTTDYNKWYKNDSK